MPETEMKTIVLNGRIDSNNAQQAENEILAQLKGYDAAEVVLDAEKLEYISSAGLRVLLSTQKVMNKQGRMVIRGASPEVMEIFDVTGFSDILTIE